MHYCLPDIEYAGVVFGEDAGEQCRLTGVVVAGEVNQYSLAQEVSQSQPTSGGAGGERSSDSKIWR